VVNDVENVDSVEKALDRNSGGVDVCTADDTYVTFTAVMGRLDTMVG
jgi:hypothetical protein